MDPEYKSETYYAVVIRGESFKGWRAPDVGLGSMRFIHPEHGELRIDKGQSKDWMQECWDSFLSYVKNLEQ